MKRPAFGSLIVGRELLVLFLVLLAVKLPLLTGAVDLFDAVAIELDPVLRGDLPAREAFVAGSPAESIHARWRPLSTISLASDLAMGGGRMLVVRIGNLLLYLGLFFALHRLLRGFGLASPPAAVTLALLALHPLLVPVIATIAGRAPLLGLTSFLIAAIFMTRMAPTGRDRLAAFLFALLGTLASPGTAGLAFLPLVASWAHREDLRAGLRRAAPALAAAGLTLLAGLLLFGRIGMATEGYLVEVAGLSGRITAGLNMIGGPFLAQVLSPTAVSPDAAGPSGASLGGKTLLGALLLLALILLALRARKRGRGLTALGFAMTPIMLLPATPIFLNGPLPGPAEVLPALLMMAFPIAALLNLPLLAARRRTRLLLGIGLVGLALFSLLRCWPWHDPELLLQSLPTEGPLAALDRSEEEGRAMTAPRDARAVEREIIGAALERFPREPRLVQERLRIELRPGGQPALAFAFLQGLEPEPPRPAGIEGLLGSLAAAAGDMRGAQNHWLAGLADPQDALSRFWLAQDAARAGDSLRAKQLFLAALEVTRGPAEQGLAVRALLQLDYLRQRGEVEASNLAALIRRQLIYAPRAEDRERLQDLLGKVES